jgi:hypothetical protein
MSQSPNTPGIRHRHAPKRRHLSILSSAGGMAGLAPAAAGAGGAAPRLVMADREDAKSSIIAGSLTTLLHAGGIGVLILLAWLAPPVQELIQVKIIRELPGADVEPAPARKIIKPRQRRQVTAARRVTAQAVTQPRVVNLTPEQLKMNQIRKAVAPQAVQRRQVVSNRTQVRSIDQRVIARDVDLSNLQNLTVAPTDLDAPIVNYDGPREIDPGAALQAPENFAEIPEVNQVDYSSAAPLEVISEDIFDAGIEAYDFDTDVGAYAGGNGTGGNGAALGVVPCFESAFVQRYLLDVKNRTTKRWQVPKGVPDDSEVVLRFVLDASGAATRVEFVGDAPPVLGNSAVAALRSASPFSRMDDNVRCLSGKKLNGTFSVPTL